MDNLCNSNSEIGKFCNAVEGHSLQAIKIVHHHANVHFDQLISGHQSVNPSREATSILSGKYKRFMFVHLVSLTSSRKLFPPQLNVQGNARVNAVNTHSKRNCFLYCCTLVRLSTFTGWTNVNLFYFPGSIEIASLQGLTLFCPEINQSKQPLA